MSCSVAIFVLVPCREHTQYYRNLDLDRKAGGCALIYICEWDSPISIVPSVGTLKPSPTLIVALVAPRQRRPGIMDAVLAQVHAIHDDGVNTTSSTGNAEIEQNFTDWLRDNGAEFGSVDWPSRDTAGRVRGAVARRDIATWVSVIFIFLAVVLGWFCF